MHPSGRTTLTQNGHGSSSSDITVANSPIFQIHLTTRGILLGRKAHQPHRIPGCGVTALCRQFPGWRVVAGGGRVAGVQFSNAHVQPVFSRYSSAYTS